MALGIAEREENTTVDVLLTRIGLNGGMPSIMALLNLFYGAAVQYCSNKNLSVDFSKSDVSDWLDEIGLEKTMQLMTQGLTQYFPKNGTPPGTAGETVTPLETVNTSPSQN